MREIANVRQVEGEPHRRFFQGSDLELTVWYESAERRRITGFQLCYGTDHSSEHALTWLEGQTASHTAVNNIGGRFYASSTLKVNGQINLAHVKKQYGDQLNKLDEPIRDCIAAIMAELEKRGYSTKPIFSSSQLD